ncbi:hypothetical protein CTAYLR_003953 [Chrysophaeum taylorii]|uniref:Uncharacterized protein n=1 Tax=Chrysophaeum taylorii TaxID=2483200 RepID=A0AAD7UBQ4_9STRA|nr:hypothetical protein CTAYLR_003953 [Chrysophaeum taylorii]
MAMYLVTTAGISSDADPARVQAIKYFFSLVFYTAWALISPMFCRWSDPRSWALMLYGSWIPGSFADVLQQWAQAHAKLRFFSRQSRSGHSSSPYHFSASTCALTNSLVGF